MSPAVAEAERNCNAYDNLDEIAQDFISRCKKGSINQAFPGELYGSTLGDIFAGTGSSHRTAQKLLTRRVYDKFEAAPAVSPDGQTTTVNGDATWSVTVNQDPQYGETLVFVPGDGSVRTGFVPQGSSATTLEFYANFPMGQPTDIYSQSAYIEGGVFEGVQLPAGEAAYVLTYHGC